jgi:chorismate mutase
VYVLPRHDGRPRAGQKFEERMNDRTAATAPQIDPELQRLRDSIDNIDAALIHLLAERFKCTQRVGEFKAQHRLPPADPGREARQIARLRELARNAKLDPEFAEKFLNFIIAEVIRHHEAIRARG